MSEQTAAHPTVLATVESVVFTLSPSAAEDYS